MRIAYLECFSGISGDMFLGALVDAGVPATLLEETVAALNVGARLEISRVVRSGISATKVDVWVDGEKDLPREEFWKRKLAHAHEHSGHGHDHEHEHHRDQQSDPGETRAGAPAPHEHFACYTFLGMCLSRSGCRDEALPSCARLGRTNASVPTLAAPPRVSPKFRAS
jgi:hypothetical protein